MLLFTSPGVHAQPVVTFEFDSMFGQRGFYIATFPPNEIPPDGFTNPTGVDWMAESQIIVADQGNRKLQLCDDQGSCSWIGLDGQGGNLLTRNHPGTFDLPHGVEVNKEGKFAVADEDNHAVQLCNTGSACKYIGESISARNEPSSALGRWRLPDDVAFDSANNLYGLDTGNNRIQILRSGDLFILDVFMTKGSALGQINNARGMAIDKDDQVIIADTGNNRIQICDTVPNCTAFGSQGTEAGQFNGPVGVDVDGLGRIWVADTGNHRIQACDYEGNCVAFGEFGTGAGQFDGPSDVAVHPSGRVAVVDTKNHRIQLFRTEASFRIQAGLNDAWFNPETDGQGFFITVFPDLGLVLLAWFTYDTELPPANVPVNLGDAGHRWLTAVGSIDGNQAEMVIEIASGGIFDTASEVLREQDGTITLTFADCNSGTVEYNIPSINQSGTVPIQRIANDNIALCEMLSAEP